MMKKDAAGKTYIDLLDVLDVIVVKGAIVAAHVVVIALLVLQGIPKLLITLSTRHRLTHEGPFRAIGRLPWTEHEALTWVNLWAPIKVANSDGESAGTHATRNKLVESTFHYESVKVHSGSW